MTVDSNPRQRPANRPHLHSVGPSAEPIALAVPGARHCPGFLSAAGIAALVARIDGEPWGGAGRERRQDYGYRYDMHRRTLAPATTFPAWLSQLTGQLLPFTGAEADQATITEIVSGRGLTRHLDNPERFGPTIALLNPADTLRILFELVGAIGGRHRHEVPLKTGDLLLLTDDARYRWTMRAVPHSRGRHLLITLRTVV